jgi:hypothetical protein
MLAQQPQVAGPADGRSRRIDRRYLVSLVNGSGHPELDQQVDFRGLEAAVRVRTIR